MIIIIDTSFYLSLYICIYVYMYIYIYIYIYTEGAGKPGRGSRVRRPWPQRERSARYSRSDK